MSLKNQLNLKFHYQCQKNWPQKTMTQVGISNEFLGILQIDMPSYCFFEAFPQGHSYVRGEGRSFQEAEVIAYQKYLKKVDCKHEFKPFGDRGQGKCHLCGDVEGNIFESTIVCDYCGKLGVHFHSSKSLYGSYFFCYQDFEEHTLKTVESWIINGCHHDDIHTFYINCLHFVTIQYFKDKYQKETEYLSEKAFRDISLTIQKHISKISDQNEELFDFTKKHNKVSLDTLYKISLLLVLINENNESTMLSFLKNTTLTNETIEKMKSLKETIIVKN